MFVIDHSIRLNIVLLFFQDSWAMVAHVDLRRFISPWCFVLSTFCLTIGAWMVLIPLLRFIMWLERWGTPCFKFPYFDLMTLNFICVCFPLKFISHLSGSLCLFGSVLSGWDDYRPKSIFFDIYFNGFRREIRFYLFDLNCQYELFGAFYNFFSIRGWSDEGGLNSE